MIKLLSTDFDGTVINHEKIPMVAPEFFDVVGELRKQGAVWAINTGRVLWHIEEGLRELKSLFERDFVLTWEREVFHRVPDGRWQDYGDWNARCIVAHDTLYAS